MQMMMPTMRTLQSRANDPEMMSQIQELCPAACVEETIETEKSFTILTDDAHERAWKLWKLPEGRSKEDAVFIELFFKTLDVEVTKIDPFTFFDLLSSIGGTLGLFLGGSIFSLIEFMLVAFFFSMSMMSLFLKKTFKVEM